MPSTSKKRALVSRLRRGREARANLLQSNLGETIAYQIRATRNKREWSQSELALATGMSQNNISRMESPDYGKLSITTLKRLADAFDVALDVKFVPFSHYIDWLSGTSRADEGISPEAMAVDGFEDEEKRGIYDESKRVWVVDINPNPRLDPDTLNPKTARSSDLELKNGDAKNSGAYMTDFERVS